MGFYQRASKALLHLPQPLLLLLGSNAAAAVPEPHYDLLETGEACELRRYAPYVIAATMVDGNLDAAGNEGFRRLFGYISGKNEKKRSIPMTAPVTFEVTSEPVKIPMTAPVGRERIGESWRVSFIMPAGATTESLPTAMDSRIQLVPVPGRLVACIRYSGRSNQKMADEKCAVLYDWIRSRGLQAVGKPIIAGYNPPFTPGPFRRNEVLIPVERGH